MQQPTPPYRPGELIQVAATVAAVAVALAAVIMQGQNPLDDTSRIAAVLFSLSGSSAIVGAGYAIFEVLAEVWVWSRGQSRLPDPVSHVNAIGWTALATLLLLPPSALLLLETIK